MRLRPPRRMVAAAVAVAIVALTGCDGSRSADLAAPAGTEASPDREQQAVDDLAALESALSKRDRGSVVEVGASRQASRELAMLVENARRLDLRDVDLRLLADSATTLTRRQQERWGAEAWVADVQVTWRYGGVDRTRSTLTVPFAFDPVAGGGILDPGLPQAERAPLWLLERVRVARGKGAVAVTTGERRPAGYLEYAEDAVRTARRSLPQWKGVLCVVVPSGQGSFRDVAGVTQEQAAAIAAVTTTPDGTSERGSPQHVYLNPRLFEPLGTEGRQIVVSHEAAHVALGAALLDVPTWLSEGIADYVALVDSDTPVEALAAQILRQTSRDGAPRALPGSRAFDGSDDRIGAWYEAAWLAVRLIAQTYGEEALWRFYRRSVTDQGTTAAFREVLGTSQRGFVQDWRSSLVSLAG